MFWLKGQREKIVIPSEVEVEEAHRPKARLLTAGIWGFTCPECSFEATHHTDLGRFDVLVCGNPFVRHVCHEVEGDVGIRELIEELELDLEEVEIEY
jgi:hypothetical protein